MLLSVAVITLTVVVGWMFKFRLANFARIHPALYPAAGTFTAILLAALALTVWMEARLLRRTWRKRVASRTGLANLSPQPVWQLLGNQFPDPLEWMTSSLWRSRWGKVLQNDWEDAGFGEKASRYAIVLVLAALTGYQFGSRIAGPLLGVALSLVVPLFPRALVSARAATHRRRFGDQLPQALDSIASGLAAGLSFQQALEFATDDLPEPARDAFTMLSRRLTLGFSLDQALQRVLEIFPDESLALAVDGIVIQRQFGGNMVGMLEDIAEVLRARLELEREVRAITTQGRLSGIIIAGLVPVSAGFLLTFNPEYIDILFDTIVGQILVIAAIILQLIGWAVISRLVRIRY